MWLKRVFKGLMHLINFQLRIKLIIKISFNFSNQNYFYHYFQEFCLVLNYKLKRSYPYLIRRLLHINQELYCTYIFQPNEIDTFCFAVKNFKISKI